METLALQPIIVKPLARLQQKILDATSRRLFWDATKTVGAAGMVLADVARSGTIEMPTAVLVNTLITSVFLKEIDNAWKVITATVGPVAIGLGLTIATQDPTYSHIGYAAFLGAGAHIVSESINHPRDYS